MLDIELIRNDPERVKRALLKRMDSVDLSPVLEADRELRRILTALNDARTERNQIAKSIGAARQRGEAMDPLQARATELKSMVSDLEQSLTKVQERFDALMLELPNMPDERVPAGGKEANVCVRTWGEKPELGKAALAHVAIALKHRLVDFEGGVKLGGSRFWLCTGDGAGLEWALLN